jgi:Rps23 Pro-64 3,4-dihydroxylase Tpa1-like proline 4-hydroxylase
MYSLAPRADVEQLCQRLAKSGRVHVPGLLLHEHAVALHGNLAQRTDWRLVFNRADELYEFDAPSRAKITAAQLADLQRAVENAGRDAFQYYYETIRVADAAAERAHDEDPLSRLADFLNSSAFLVFARQLLGREDIAFADCQATRYRRGHFLNMHDDAVEGKQRVAAYVLNLTPRWRPEWGGQLQFISPAGHVEEGFVPSFNALNVLRVPQPHLVSMVNSMSPPDAQRVSVTGWLRTGTPP